MSTKPRQVREDRQGTQPWQHLHHLGAPAAAPHGPHLDAAVPLGRDEGSRALEAAAAQVAVGFQDCWRAHGHGSHKPQNPPWAMHLLPRATSITPPPSPDSLTAPTTPRATHGGRGGSPVSPGWWDSSSTASSRAAHTAMPAPAPGPAASLYLSWEIGEVKGHGRPQGRC